MLGKGYYQKHVNCEKLMDFLWSKKKSGDLLRGNSGVEAGLGKVTNHEAKSPEPFLQELKVVDSLDTYSKAITSWHVIFMRYSPHNYWHHPMTSTKTFEAVKHAACPVCLLLLVQPKLTGDMMPFRKVLILRGLGYGIDGDFIIRICGKKIHHPKMNEGTSSKGNHISQPFDC